VGVHAALVWRQAWRLTQKTNASSEAFFLL
jgi:hypothetical protein